MTVERTWIIERFVSLHGWSYLAVWLYASFAVVRSEIVSQAKGSAYIEVGKTKVIVSVFDPREIPNKTEYSQKGELYCEFKYATFSCPNRRMHQQDPEEKQNSIVLKQALEPAVCLHEFPNFQIDIYAMVIENDGSALAAAITCAGAALAHAGVPMYDVVTGISLGLLDGDHIMDPTLHEQQLCNVSVSEEGKDHGVITMAMLSTHQQITQLYLTGNIGLENIDKGVAHLKDGMKDVVPLIERCIVKHVLKTINRKQNED